MEFENEKKTEELSTEQQSQNHESGYQGYRPGRSPRPRIQKPRPAQYGQQGGYNRNQEQEEGGFRPEGFGAGLMSGLPAGWLSAAWRLSATWWLPAAWRLWPAPSVWQ